MQSRPQPQATEPTKRRRPRAQDVIALQRRVMAYAATGATQTAPTTYHR